MGEKLASQIGKVLYNLRLEKNIGQEELCYGLCSDAALSRYELGERMPDRLLLIALLQRLGKSADGIATMLDAKEYTYFAWRKQVLEAAGKEDTDTLKELLSQPEAGDLSCNEILQKQFLYRMRSVVAEAEGADVEAIDWLKEAIRFTIPEPECDKLGHSLLSIEEMKLLVKLAELQLVVGKIDEAKKLLRGILTYSEQQYDDVDALLSVYPRTVRVLSPLLMERGEYAECFVLCQKAIEFLRNKGTLMDLTFLLRQYLDCAKHGIYAENAQLYQNALEALEAVYQSYGFKASVTEQRSEYYFNQEIYLVGEVLKQYRIKKAISQEELSEGICTPETISRIESGKRAPNTKNYYALAQKLDAEVDYFDAGIDTEDFSLILLKRELDVAIARRKWDKAEEMLEQLKTGLEKEGKLLSPRNQMGLKPEEYCIRYNQKKCSAEEFMAVCEQLADCENERWREESYWKQFLTRDKVRILNYIAVLYTIRRELDKATIILERILSWLEKSSVGLTERYSESLIVMLNLAITYSKLKNNKKCVQMSEKCIRFCLSCGRGTTIPLLIANQVEVLIVSVDDTAECKMQLRQAYYIGKLFHNKVYESINEHYVGHFGDSIEGEC